MSNRYLTPNEVALRLRGRINTKTLANWRSQKIGPRFTRFGNRILYSELEFETWEQSQARMEPDGFGTPVELPDGVRISSTGVAVANPAQRQAQENQEAPEHSESASAQSDAARQLVEEGAWTTPGPDTLDAEIAPRGSADKPLPLQFIEHRGRLYRGYGRAFPLLIWTREHCWRNVVARERPEGWGQLISRREAERLYPGCSDEPVSPHIVAAGYVSGQEYIKLRPELFDGYDGPTIRQSPEELRRAIELLRRVLPAEVEAALRLARAQRQSRLLKNGR